MTRSFVWQVTNPGPLADPDSGTTPNDRPLQGNVLPNDGDPDGDKLAVQQFTVAGLPGTYAAGETVLIPNVGTLTLNADGSYTFVAAERYAGDVPLVSYRITDGEGGTAESTLQIVVTQTNGVPPLPPDAPVNTDPGLPGTVGLTLQTLRYGQNQVDGGQDHTDADDTETGGVLHIEYWSFRPEVIRITRGPSPALFVTHAVRESQAAAVQPQEPGVIQSRILAERLAMYPDLHVLRAVDASQRQADAQDIELASQRLADTPGANNLFNDFDPLIHLGHRPAADAERDNPRGDAGPRHASGQAPARGAPSFTQQLNQAAGAARPPVAATPAPTSTPRN